MRPARACSQTVRHALRAGTVQFVSDPRDPESTRALVTRELQPGEHLLWSGTSDPAVLFTPRDAFLIPFSLLWCGFAVFWVTAAAQSGAPLFAVLFGSVFVLLGLHLVVGRFIVKRHRKRTTAYAVTDRRALMTNGRRTLETPASRTDRTTRWSRDRSHCSVQWQDQSARGFGSWNNNQQMYANTGLDGLFGPVTAAFWDVRDGDGLNRALEQAAGRGQG